MIVDVLDIDLRIFGLKPSNTENLIKDKLINNGYIFKSETDTEVIANLILHYYNKSRDEVFDNEMMKMMGFDFEDNEFSFDDSFNEQSEDSNDESNDSLSSKGIFLSLNIFAKPFNPIFL